MNSWIIIPCMKKRAEGWSFWFLFALAMQNMMFRTHECIYELRMLALEQMLLSFMWRDLEEAFLDWLVIWQICLCVGELCCYVVVSFDDIACFEFFEPLLYSKWIDFLREMHVWSSYLKLGWNYCFSFFKQRRLRNEVFLVLFNYSCSCL